MDCVQVLEYAARNAFGILCDVTGDLTQEQADWQPPGLANPIGASYWHVLSSCDYIVHQWGQGLPVLTGKTVTP